MQSGNTCIVKRRAVIKLLCHNVCARWWGVSLDIHAKITTDLFLSRDLIFSKGLLCTLNVSMIFMAHFVDSVFNRRLSKTIANGEPFVVKLVNEDMWGNLVRLPALFITRYSTTFPCPPCAARCKAVHLKFFLRLMSASRSTSALRERREHTAQQRTGKHLLAAARPM